MFIKMNGRQLSTNSSKIKNPLSKSSIIEKIEKMESLSPKKNKSYVSMSIEKKKYSSKNSLEISGEGIEKRGHGSMLIKLNKNKLGPYIKQNTKRNTTYINSRSSSLLDTYKKKNSMLERSPPSKVENIRYSYMAPSTVKEEIDINKSNEGSIKSEKDDFGSINNSNVFFKNEYNKITTKVERNQLPKVISDTQIINKKITWKIDKKFEKKKIDINKWNESVVMSRDSCESTDVKDIRRTNSLSSLISENNDDKKVIHDLILVRKILSIQKKFREFRSKKLIKINAMKKYEYIYKFIRLDRLMKLFIKKMKIIYNCKRVFKIETFDIFINKENFQEKIKKLSLIENGGISRELENINYDSNYKSNENELDNQEISYNFNFSFIGRRKNDNLKYLRVTLVLQNWFRRVNAKLKLRKLQEERNKLYNVVVSGFIDSVIKVDEKYEEVYLKKFLPKIQNKKKISLKGSRSDNSNFGFYLNNYILEEKPHKKEKDSIKINKEDEEGYDIKDEAIILKEKEINNMPKMTENIKYDMDRSNNLIKVDEEYEEVYLKKFLPKIQNKKKISLKGSRSNNNNFGFYLNNYILEEKPHKKEKDSIKINKEDEEGYDIKDEAIILKEKEINNMPKMTENIKYDMDRSNNLLEQKNEIINDVVPENEKESDEENNLISEKWEKLLKDQPDIDDKNNEKNDLQPNSSKKKDSDKIEVSKITKKDSQVNIIKTNSKTNSIMKHDMKCSKNQKQKVPSKENSIKPKDLDLKKIIKIQKYVRKFIERKKSNMERKNCCACYIY